MQILTNAGHTTTLDLAAVLKSLQTISGEMEFERLLTSLVQIALETAGAQRGLLILEPDGEYQIQESTIANQETVMVLQGNSAASSQQLSTSIVNYVRETRENLVISDAGQDVRFQDDPYIVQTRPKSVLCLPILNQGNIRGILYLENNLKAGAFTPNQVETLKILTIQAAISLENARLYTEMKRESGERRRAEEVLHAITRGTAAVTGGDFFRSLLRHIASAFHVRRAFITECTNDTMLRVRTLAYIESGDFRENFEYDLAGTPCEGVIAGSVCYYPRGLRNLFPIEKRMDSYLGAPLMDTSGRILGHLAVLDDKPLELDSHAKDILAIFTTRAGVELERKRSEDALQKNEQQLRQLYGQLEDYSRNLEQKVAQRTREIERRHQVAESLRDILATLNSNRPLEEILGDIVARAGSLLESDTSAIYRLQKSENRFQIQSIQGQTTDALATADLPIWVTEKIREGQPVAIGDMQASPEEITRLCRALMATPLWIADKIYGCLVLFYANEQQFSREDLMLAVAFSDQVGLSIENALLRQRDRKAAILEERGRLARELHDSVTQSLYSLTLLTEGWQRMLKSGKLELKAESLSEIGEIAQQALKEMRLLVYELRPTALEQEGLLGALNQRISAVEKRAGIEVRLEADSPIKLPAPMEEGLYRIAQEALNNSLKHARAESVTIQVRMVDGWVMLAVADDGEGFDPSIGDDHGGIGLVSMRERTQRLGGVLEIQSTPGEGTVVKVRVPTGAENV